MLRFCSNDLGPGRWGVDTRSISGNIISCFPYHYVLSLVNSDFTKLYVNFARIWHEICSNLTLTSHSQPDMEDARFEPCEWKRNLGSEAIVHQGHVSLVCTILVNLLKNFLTHSCRVRGAAWGTLWQNTATFTLGSTPIQKERYRPFTKGTYNRVFLLRFTKTNMYMAPPPKTNPIENSNRPPFCCKGFVL